MFLVLMVFCKYKILLGRCLNFCVTIGRIGNNTIIIRSEVEKKLHEEEDSVKSKQEKSSE